MSELDASREQLQTILDNLTAGVVLLDSSMNIMSSNPGATRILQVPLAAYERKARIAAMTWLHRANSAR